MVNFVFFKSSSIFSFKILLFIYSILLSSFRKQVYLKSHHKAITKTNENNGGKASKINYARDRFGWLRQSRRGQIQRREWPRCCPEPYTSWHLSLPG